MRISTLMCVALVLIGCAHERRSNSAPDQTQSPGNSDRADENQTVDAGPGSLAFGIADDFSGKLTEEQEKAVPEPLRGAFYIGSLTRITTSELEEKLKFATLIAEERRDGRRLVALQEFRHVIFSDEVSGQMIVIERYLLIPE
jgi:hypothetical protein